MPAATTNKVIKITRNLFLMEYSIIFSIISDTLYKTTKRTRTFMILLAADCLLPALDDRHFRRELYLLRPLLLVRTGFLGTVFHCHSRHIQIVLLSLHGHATHIQIISF